MIGRLASSDLMALPRLMDCEIELAVILDDLQIALA